MSEHRQLVCALLLAGVLGMCLLTPSRAFSQWTILGSLQSGGGSYSGTPACTFHDDTGLYIGTDRGLWVYDGEKWRKIPINGGTRWIGRSKGRLFAAGSAGLWDVATAQRDAAAPDSVRCGLLVGDVLWLGTRTGLYRGRPSQEWRQEIPEVRIENLDLLPGGQAESPLPGSTSHIVAGSWGQGLFVQNDDGSWKQMLVPYAGVEDSLPGNFIHDLEVDDEGRLHVVCCHHGITSGYVVYRNSLVDGLVDPADGHLCHGSAHAIWSSEGWKVEYFVQDFPGTPDGENDLTTLYVGDLDGDGRTERLMRLNPDRRLHPRMIALFDEETLQLRWKKGTSANPIAALPVRHAGNTALLILGMATSNGAQYRDHDDTWGFVELVSGEGSVLARWDIKGLTHHHTYLDQEDLQDGFVDQNLYLELNDADHPEATQLYVFDPARMALLRKGILPYHTSMHAGRASHVWRTPKGIVASQRVIDSDNREYVRIFDLTHPDSTIDTLSARALRLNGVFGHFCKRTVRQGHDGGWELVTLNSWGVSFSNSQHTQHKPWADSELAGNILWASKVAGYDEAWLRYDGNGHVDLWVRPGTVRSQASDPTTHGIGFPNLILPGAAKFENFPGFAQLRQVAALHSPNTLNPFVGIYYYAPLLGKSGDEIHFLSCTFDTPNLSVVDDRGNPLASLSTPSWLAESKKRLLVEDACYVETAPQWILVGRHETPPWQAQAYSRRDGHRGPVLDLEHGFQDIKAAFASSYAPESGVLASSNGLRLWTSTVDSRGGFYRSIHGGAPARILGGTHSSVVVSEGDSLLWLRDASTVVADSARCLSSDGRMWIDTTAMVWRDGRRSSQQLSLSSQLFWPLRIFGGPQRRWIGESRTDFTGARVYSLAAGKDRLTMLLNTYLQYTQDTHAILDSYNFPDNSRLLATDAGLLLVSDDGLKCAVLADRSLHFRTVFEQRGSVFATTAKNVCYEVTGGGGSCEAEVSDKLLALRSPILGWDRSRDPRWWYARHQIGPSASIVDFSAAVRLAPTIHDLASDCVGGAWIATSRGLYHVDSRTRLPLPVSSAVVPHEDLREIGLVTSDPARGDSILVRSDAGTIRSLRIPPTEGRTMAHFDDDEEILASVWGAKDLWCSSFLARIDGRGDWILLASDRTARLQQRASLPALDRGRHRIEVLALDLYGRPVGQPVVLSHRVLAASSGVTLTILFLVIVLGGIWALGYRKVRGDRWSLVYLALTVVGLLLVDKVFSYRVPWVSTVPVAVAFAAVGIIVRRRVDTRSLEPKEARERLGDLVRAFQHRSGGIGPTDEAILLLRNAEHLSALDLEGMTRMKEALERCLRATDGFHREAPLLLECAEVEPWVSQRASGPLQQMRALALPAVEDFSALQLLVSEDGRRQAFLAASVQFLEGMEALGVALEALRSCDLAAVVAEQERRVDLSQNSKTRVNIEGAEQPLWVVAPRAEVEELLDNLLRNAIRAMGQEDEVTIQLRLRQENTTAILDLADSGPGVPKDLRNHIFERGVSGAGGSGFGLHHCRELVRSWGGSIELADHSAAPVLSGACFEVRIPVLKR